MALPLQFKEATMGKIKFRPKDKPKSPAAPSPKQKPAKKGNKR
jgi:hypothetical protein